jgi:hypothetical protein
MGEPLLFPDSILERTPHTKRRVQGGVSTSKVITSAHIGDDSDIFPKILDLHVPKGATVADVTYGKWCFGKR